MNITNRQLTKIRPARTATANKSIAQSSQTESPNETFKKRPAQSRRFDPWSKSRAHLESGVEDMAGKPPTNPNPLQMQQRIGALVNKLLDPEVLTARLADLKKQFTQPMDRPWDGPIKFKEISEDMIVGIEPSTFIAVLNGASQIEDPIKNYAKESHDYLTELHPELATFMGGTYDVDGEPSTKGVWLKEERRHNPLFSKLHEQLTGKKPIKNPNSVSDAIHTSDPRADVRRHGMSRVSTEWAAVSGYIWLMAHSTGELQYAIAQAAQDEVNHFAKFWGYMKHAYPEKNLLQTTMEMGGSLAHLVTHNAGERKVSEPNSASTPGLSIYDLKYVPEAASAYTRTMGKMYAWDSTLTSEKLGYLFGPDSSRAGQPETQRTTQPTP